MKVKTIIRHCERPKGAWQSNCKKVDCFVPTFVGTHNDRAGSNFQRNWYKLGLMIFITLLILMFSGIGYAATTSTLSVTATVLSKSNCKFNSKTATLNFGTLDPANPVDKSLSTTISFRCLGSANPATFSITDDDGLYETGTDANRMRHATIITEFIPYGFTLNPISGTVPKNIDQTLTISGTVTGTDYQNASIGNYSDSVVISINP